MTEPTKEQLQKFWEWCGFKYVFGEMVRTGEFTEQNYYWESPTGKKYFELPQLDLNHLFKYAVPKVQDVGGCWIQTEYDKNTQEFQYRACIYMVGGYFGVGISKDPALALFWAIWKVIDG